MSLSAPIAVPSTTTLANLLGLIYTMSADLSASNAITGTTANGSPTVTALSSTTGLVVGQTVTGAGIPANTYVTSISGTTMNLSQNATASGTGVALTVATVQSFALIDGSLLLVSFSALPTNVRVKFEARPVLPSTIVPLYSY